jgi:TPR repeat protein
MSELDKLIEQANEGDLTSQYRLGLVYYHGPAASQYGLRILPLNEIVERDLTQAKHWFGEAARRGHARSQCNLGICYLEDSPPHPDQAVEWFRKSADQGIALAQCNLGDCYYSGKGVAQDLAAAAHWYGLAAEQDDIVAKLRLMITVAQIMTISGENMRGKLVEKTYDALCPLVPSIVATLPRREP